MPYVREDVVGNRYGRLIVLRNAPDRKRRHRQVVCRCDCGTEKIVFLDALRKGVTVSCGCRMREISGIYRKTHGRTNTREFAIWSGLRQRCINPNNPMYPRYGGRGITVCSAWMESFQAFFADMGERPSKSHSIDRIDNNGNYSPENCRWATQVVQANNKSTNHVIEHEGQAKTITEWAIATGIPAKRIQERIYRGWGFSDILAEPYVSPKRRGERMAPYTEERRNQIAQYSKLAWQDPEKKVARLKKRAETMRLRQS